MSDKELLPAPKNAQEAMDIATKLARSGFVPTQFANKPEAVFVAMMWSKVYGMPIVQGLQSIAVVNGKPSLYGDAALAVVNASGLLVDISEELTTDSNGCLTAVCTVKRKDRQTPTRRTFSQSDAEAAGLWGRNVWKSYPKRMLQMRARAFALRDAFPDVLSGISIYEEAQDINSEDNAADSPATTTRKGPQRKSKVKPTPENVEDVEVIEPKKIEAPQQSTEDKAAEIVTETVEPQPAQPVTDDQPPLELTGEADTFDWKSALDTARDVKQLMPIWNKIPAETQKTEECRQRFRTRKAELVAQLREEI